MESRIIVSRKYTPEEKELIALTYEMEEQAKAERAAGHFAEAKNLYAQQVAIFQQLQWGDAIKRAKHEVRTIEDAEQQHINPWAPTPEGGGGPDRYRALYSQADEARRSGNFAEAKTLYAQVQGLCEQMGWADIARKVKSTIREIEDAERKAINPWNEDKQEQQKQRDDEAQFKSSNDAAQAERVAGNLTKAKAIYADAIQRFKEEPRFVSWLQQQAQATLRAERRGINPWKVKKEHGKSPYDPREVPNNVKRFGLYLTLIGGAVGFGTGWWGSTPLEGAGWAILLGLSFYFLVISLYDAEQKKDYSHDFNGMVLKQQLIQVGVFTGLGVLLGLGTGDAFGPIYGWRLGLILSTAMGILVWSFYFNGGLWVIILPVLAGIGAGIGALVGLAGAGAGAGATIGALVSVVGFYCFMLIPNRSTGILFDVLLIGGLIIGAIVVPSQPAGLYSGPMGGCLAGATIGFAGIIGVAAVRYIRIFVRWKAPKDTDGIFGQWYLHG